MESSSEGTHESIGDMDIILISMEEITNTIKITYVIIV